MLEGSLLVVEPHCDDAFLSLGWHIEKLWGGERVTILTVFCDKQRTGESHEYAGRIGCHSICLGHESQYGLKDSDEAEVESFGPLCEWLLEYEDGYEAIIYPLGLQHPDHRNCAACTSGSVKEFHYVDTPYQSKPMNSDELLQKCFGRTVASICFPPKRKWRHKDVFKSQAKFFHFNPMQDWKLPEIVLC